MLNKIKLHRYIALLGLLLILVYFAVSLKSSEHVLYRNGLGWDGGTYAEWAQRGTLGFLKAKSMPTYYLQRILPSTIVHYVAKIINYNLDNPKNIIIAFQIYNDCLILFSIILIWLIAKHLRWKPQTFFISIASLIFSFAVLKFPQYYPVLTDISGFFWVLLIFYFYLKNRPILLIIASLTGSFTFPSMIYLSLPCLLFPIQDNSNNQLDTPTANKININFIIAIICSGFLTYRILHAVPPTGLYRGDLPPIVISLVPITALCSFAYCAYFLFYLIDIKFFWSKIKTSTNLKRICVGGLFFIAMYVIAHFFATRNPESLSIRNYISITLRGTATAPFYSLVSHIMYFGPTFLLIIFFWESITKIVKKYGYAMILLSFIAVFMFLNPESRQLTNLVPIFSILACDVLNKRGVSWSFTYFFIIISLIVSRFWFTINYIDWSQVFLLNKIVKLTDFPQQIYFMNNGAWLSFFMYTVFLSISIILAICVFNMLKADALYVGKTQESENKCIH